MYRPNNAPVVLLALVAALLASAAPAQEGAEQDKPEHGAEAASQPAPDSANPRSGAKSTIESALREQSRMPEWLKKAAEAWEAGDHDKWVAALEQLHQLRPFNYDFMRQLVMGYALTGQTSKAFNMMLTMQQQGLAEDWDEVDEVESLRQYPLYDHLNDLMTAAGQPSGQVETVFTIDPEHPMPEAIAHDAETGRTFIGTVRDGTILVHEPDDSELEVFADPESVPGLMAVFALLVDEKRDHLWVATAGTRYFREATPSDQGRTALIKLDKKTGEKLGEYRVLPDGRGHLLGALAQAGDGTVYATDSRQPQVYRLPPGADRPEPFVGHPIFTGLRGIALSQDESRLYLADYDLGVFFFELGDESGGFALGIPETLNLGGIDGLYRWNSSLVAIQNGVTPQRVLRLDLDDSGTRVAKVAAVAVAQPQFDTPTFGTMVGDDLVFLGASHWNHVDGTGRPLDPPLPAIPVLRAPVDQAEHTMLGKEALEELRRSGRPIR